jgi:hypothetical protein
MVVRIQFCMPGSKVRNWAGLVVTSVSEVTTVADMSHDPNTLGRSSCDVTCINIICSGSGKFSASTEAEKVGEALGSYMGGKDPKINIFSYKNSGERPLSSIAINDLVQRYKEGR